MSKITIIDGNNEIELSTAPKENIKAYMVKGEPGTNGVSPSAVVTKVDDTSTLTVTDANGTTQTNIMDGYNPTITAEKENKVTTLTITDINGTTTTEIYDGLDITGGVPTNAVMGFDVTELIYTCDGTESGTYYFTYENNDYYFIMPNVSDGDKLIFNIDDLELTLDGNIISTSSSGTGTELTFVDSIPAGYEETNEPFPGAGSITVHDSYSTSTTEPYSANYVNSNTPTISDSYSTSTTGGYSANYINSKLTENTITIGLSTDYTYTARGKVPLDVEIAKTGTKLSFDSTNNGIVVGTGVSYIEVSANSLQTPNAPNLCGVLVCKNGISLNDAVGVGFSYLPTASQIHCISISPVIVSVSQGDIIYFYAYTTNTTVKLEAYSGKGNYLTAKVIS